MSIQSEINRIVGFRDDALAAVAEKGVTVPQGSAIDDLPGLIRSIETGRDDLTFASDVDFIDFDGRLLYSYTASEFLALSALPANPSYPGLVAQGWNWTLADAQAYVQQHGCLVVGQNYTTDTGRTRIYISIPTRATYRWMNVYVSYCSVANNFKIYWGDGATTNGGDATNWLNLQHQYSQPGDYVIEIEVLNGTIGLGYPYSNNGIVESTGKKTPRVVKIEFGNGVVKLGKQPFAYMLNLATISIPNTLTEIEQAVDTTAFKQCASLKAVVFPSGFGGRDRKMFAEMASLRYISLPKSCTQIEMSGGYPHLRKLTMYSLERENGVEGSVITSAYYSELTHFILPGNYETVPAEMLRYTLAEKVTIPSSVTKILKLAVSNNSLLSEIHLLSTSPPTLAQSASSVFAGNASNLVFYVPYSDDHSVLEAYKTATNWSVWASKIQEEPQ